MKMVLSFLSVSSLSLMLATVADFKGDTFKIILAYFTGAVFWLFLILGYVIFFVLSRHRKTYEKTKENRSDRTDRRRESENKTGKKSLPGILRFFSNRYAVVADVVMAISIILLVIPSNSQNVTIIIVSILVLSVHFHGILNGINFEYIRELSNKKQSKRI